MYHRKRDNTLVWSNCTLNLTSLDSWSYGWWKVTERIGNTLIFNNFSYSNSTIGHQSKIRRHLPDFGLDFLIVQAPDGLQAGYESCIKYHEKLIEKLQAAIDKKGSWKSTNQGRREAIAEHLRTINRLIELTK